MELGCPDPWGVPKAAANFGAKSDARYALAPLSELDAWWSGGRRGAGFVAVAGKGGRAGRGAVGGAAAGLRRAVRRGLGRSHQYRM